MSFGIATRTGHCIAIQTILTALKLRGHRSYVRDSGVRAILINGTPSGFDSESFMLGCSAGTDRTFNPNDVIALNYLY
jgi:hypothetical protein